MATSDSATFYADLPLLDSFFRVSDPANFHPLPDNWCLAVTDIVDSTGAVDQGRYKMVNILGASPIVGILNKANKEAIPYTFGGDGCTLCIPPSMLEETREVLGASRRIGKTEYGLDLRAGIIPVKEIRDAGYEVNVARYNVSGQYNQAIFSGGGLAYAEEMLKSTEGESYRVPVNDEARGTDFTGLECRWQQVGRHGKQVITMLVRANPNRTDTEKIYRDVLREMRNTFGFDDTTNPIDPSLLNMNMSFSSLLGEYKLRTFGMDWLQRLRYFLNMEIEIILGKIFMALGYESSATNWSLYKTDLATNSDHRKFDNMLRVVISGTEEQFLRMETFLEEQYEASRLAYGLHITDTATITCMVFKYHREHIHFVDGSGGGYVKAAQKLKERMVEF